MLKNMTRLEKDNDFFKALGDVDELSASLGLAREYCATEVSTLGAHVLEIQSRLLDIGSVRATCACRFRFFVSPHTRQGGQLCARCFSMCDSTTGTSVQAIATPSDGSSTPEQLQLTQFDSGNVEVVERWIDAMDHQLPKLTNFILPSGGLAAAQLHVARTVCRRAERRVAPLVCRVPVPNFRDRAAHEVPASYFVLFCLGFGSWLGVLSSAVTTGAARTRAEFCRCLLEPPQRLFVCRCTFCGNESREKGDCLPKSAASSFAIDCRNSRAPRSQRRVIRFRNYSSCRVGIRRVCQGLRVLAEVD